MFKKLMVFPHLTAGIQEVTMFGFIPNPLGNLAESFIDNVIRDTVRPVRGSVLYCDLAFGYMEHSGIYVGSGKSGKDENQEKCIVELQRQGNMCCVRRVTPTDFISAGTAISIYVSCRGTHARGRDKIAATAESMIGQCLGEYSLLNNNCHMFTDYCLRCGDKKSCECYDFFDYVKHYANREMTLTHLKQSARKILGADTWRVWNRH